MQDGAGLIYSFTLPAERLVGIRLRNRGLVASDQLDKNFIADTLMILIILLVVVGGFTVLHTPSILLGGGLALVVAVVAEFVWSR